METRKFVAKRKRDSVLECSSALAFCWLICKFPLIQRARLLASSKSLRILARVGIKAVGAWALAGWFLMATGCSHTELAQGGAWANGPPGPSWEPESREPVSAPPHGVSEVDQDVAVLVRRTLKEDPKFGPIAKRVRINVYKGRLTLRGEVPTERARAEIIDKVLKLPGVDAVNDQLQTTR